MQVLISEIPHISIAREIENNRSSLPTKTTAAPNYEDSVSICEEGRAVSKLTLELKKIQNIKDPSLEDLKQRIANGTYDVSSEDIAKAILYGPPEKSGK
jgi:anti-sigma28 factor (negative regulator of flagellin synthesis)